VRDPLRSRPTTASDTQQEQTQRRGPRALGDTVRQLLRELGIQRPAREDRIIEQFLDLLEPRFRNVVRPIRFRHGDLLVEVRSAAHRQELITFHAARLTAALNAALAAASHSASATTDRPPVRRILFRPAS
jgi:hypothetical protein